MKKLTLMFLTALVTLLTFAPSTSAITKKEIEETKFHIELDKEFAKLDTKEDQAVTALTISLFKLYEIKYDEENKTMLFFPRAKEVSDLTEEAVKGNKNNDSFNRIKKGITDMWEAMKDSLSSEQRIAVINPEAVKKGQTEFTFSDFIFTVKNGEIEFSMFEEIKE
ncbi:hypothetical protein NHG29_04000 [Aerococcaceae bacterium NML160702]|nr:hypothetical protein [Aerococcaceae bacterium NML160702]